MGRCFCAILLVIALKVSGACFYHDLWLTQAIIYIRFGILRMEFSCSGIRKSRAAVQAGAGFRILIYRAAMVVISDIFTCVVSSREYWHSTGTLLFTATA